jgi:DNA-directed RNA polymerase specialized sigma24 family protein
VVLRYVHDLSLAEIADREGIAKGTVRDALARAHARLRRSQKQA